MVVHQEAHQQRCRRERHAAPSLGAMLPIHLTSLRQTVCGTPSLPYVPQPAPNRRRTVLLFVFRDRTRTPLEKLTETWEADLQRMWDGIAKPPQYEQYGIHDFFELQASRGCVRKDQRCTTQKQRCQPCQQRWEAAPALLLPWLPLLMRAWCYPSSPP